VKHRLAAWNSQTIKKARVPMLAGMNLAVAVICGWLKGVCSLKCEVRGLHSPGVSLEIAG